MMQRRKMTDRYRRFSFATDLGGLKSAIGEMRGIGYPKQPRLNRAYVPSADDPAFDEDWFVRTLREKVAGHPDNTMEYPFFGERVFDDPLVGFVRGDDPIFTDLKRIIGPHHYTPHEIMAWQAGKNAVPPPAAADLAVVSFVLPITERTKKENALQGKWPSERWAQTRLHGEMFSQTIVREIVCEAEGPCRTL